MLAKGIGLHNLSPTSRASREKDSDERDESSSEKTDEGIEQPQVEQPDQNKESIRLDAGQEIAGLSGSEAHQDF